MGLYEALSWIKGMELDRVLIEVDAKVVVEAVNSNKQNLSTFGNYITYPNFSIFYICRSANELTNRLAKVSRNFLSPSCWVEPPSIVDDLLDDFCTCNI